MDARMLRSRLRLIDLVALVTATAVCMALVRYYYLGAVPTGIRPIIKPDRIEFQRTVRYVWTPVRIWAVAGLVLASFTPVTLLVAIRGRAASFGGVTRHPGACALAAASAWLAIDLGWSLAESAIGGWPYLETPVTANGMTAVHRHDMFPAWAPALLGKRVGIAVLLAWAVLAISRRWRFTRRWDDWLGVGMGLGWSACFLHLLIP